MTKTQTFALGAAGIILYTMLTKKAALGTINFYHASVKGIHMDGLTPVLTLGLAAQNTSNQKFVIRSIAGNVYADNFLIGNVSNFTQQTIYPNTSGVLNLVCRLSPIGIVSQLIDAWQTGSFEMEVKLDAYANIDNYQVPIKFTYKIG